jgi:hypothetical protein
MTSAIAAKSSRCAEWFPPLAPPAPANLIASHRGLAQRQRRQAAGLDTSETKLIRMAVD